MFHLEHHITTIVQSEMFLNKLVETAKKATHIFWDTETSGLRVRVAGEDYTVGWTIAFDEDVDENVYYLPVKHHFEGVYKPHVDMERLGAKEKDFPAFTEENWVGKSYRNLDEKSVHDFIVWLFKYSKGRLIKIAHNQSFDMHLLANEGLDVNDIYSDYYYGDTMVMVHTVQEEEEKKLEKVVERAYSIKKSDYDRVVATITAEEKKAAGLKANSKATFQYVQIPIGGQYSGEDVYYMRALYPDLKDLLVQDEQMDYYTNFRVPFLLSLWNMERRGIKFDSEKALGMQRKAEKVMAEIKEKISEITGFNEVQFNISSKQHLYELFHGHKKMLKDKKSGEYKESFNAHLIDASYKFPVGEMTEGGKEKDKKLKVPKLDKDAMKTILAIEYKDKKKIAGQEVLKLIMKYNKLNKLYGTYMVGMFDEAYKDGRIHCSFNLTGTDSMRVSCSNPNMLNLPAPLENPHTPNREKFETEEEYEAEMKSYRKEKENYDFWIQFEIRSLLVADDDNKTCLTGDFKALEKRLSANLTKDPALIKMITEHIDPHGLVATFCFPDELDGVHPNEVKKIAKHLRQKGKVIGFACDYGGTEYTISKNLGISKEEARILIDNYWKGFQVQAAHNQHTVKEARRSGFVKTICGHKRHLSGINSENWGVRGYYERLCANSPIQGSGADVITASQLAVDNDAVLRALGYTMRLQCYDELMGIVNKKFARIASERVAYCMEHSLDKHAELIVPLEADFDWGDTYADSK